MPTILSRVYSDKKQAEKVIGALRDKGVLDRDISLLSLGENGLDSKSDDETLLAALAAARIYSKQGPAYAQALKKRRAIVAVAAPMGSSYVSRQVFDSHPSVDVGVPNELHVEASIVPPKTRRRTANAVLLDQRMMTKNGITDWSFSKMLGMKTVSGSRTARKTGLINGTITGKMGMKMLSERRKRTELLDGTISERFGIPTLIKSREY